MAVPGNALPAAHQPEPAFGVQGAAGRIVLQHGGLQGPVTGGLGLPAQLGEQMIPQPVAAELLADINAHLGHTPVAPARVHPAQGCPARNDAACQQHQTAFPDVGSIPGGIGRAVGLEGGYSKNEELMNNIRNVVLEEQAVDAVLAKAQVTEKASSFDEIMNPQA